MAIVEQTFFRNREEPVFQRPITGERTLIFETQYKVLEGGERVPENGLLVKSVQENSLHVVVLFHGQEIAFQLVKDEINAPSAPLLATHPNKLGFYKRISYIPDAPTIKKTPLPWAVDALP